MGWWFRVNREDDSTVSQEQALREEESPGDGCPGWWGIAVGWGVIGLDCARVFRRFLLDRRGVVTVEFLGSGRAVWNGEERPV